MTLTTITFRNHWFRSTVAGCALLLAMLTGSGAPLHAQSVVCMVTGEPITNFDVDQRSKLNFLSTHKASSRQEVLDQLIDEKVKIKEGKRYGVDPSASDMDSSYADMAKRMRVSSDQLTAILEKQGIRPETLKARLKAEMVWGSLVRGRYKERLLVSEKEVAERSGENSKVDAFEYKMQQVVLLVPKGSPPATVEARKREAEVLRERVRSCEAANSYFKSMQNGTIRAPVTRTTADLPEPLRELLDKTPIGTLTPPEVTTVGVEMVALCEKKATTVDSPKKQKIRAEMQQEKYEATQKTYLADIRKAAMIECR